MVFIIIGVHIIVEVCDIRQHSKIGVIKQLVGVHPEDVGHGVGLGGGLQLRPVFAPAGGLHFDLHIRVLGGVGLAHGFHPWALVYVPDLEGEVGLAVRCPASCQKRHEQRRRQKHWNNSLELFHRHSPLHIFICNFPKSAAKAIFRSIAFANGDYKSQIFNL